MKKVVWKYPSVLFAAISIAVSLCSCHKDEPAQMSGTGQIKPVLEIVRTKASQEATGPGQLLSERVIGSVDGFELTEYVYENTSSLPAPTTKGEVVTTGSIEAFGIIAFAEGEWHDNTIRSGELGSASDPYPAGVYFDSNASKSGGAWTIAGEPKWINDVPITFWSWNYVKPERTDTHTASFSYTVEPTAADQEDLLFAFNNERRRFNDYGEIRDGKDETLDIRFYHPLSTVQFVQHENLTGYRISGIEIQNVDSHTECVMESTDDIPAAGSPNISFTHETSIPATFSQSYTADDAAAGGSLAIPSDAATDGSFKPDDGKTFIMVPQSFGSQSTDKDSKLKITFVSTASVGAGTTSPVFDFNGRWEEGKYYVYKIDLNGNIHVSIDETCDGSTKSDVRFKNTSNVNEYIRATVVANWYDADGNIVAPWTGSITPGSGWTASNGIFYYDSVVAAGCFTGNLIDTFTKPSSAPVSGAHFEMTVLVQAVASDGYTSCFSAF